MTATRREPVVIPTAGTQVTVAYVTAAGNTAASVGTVLAGPVGRLILDCDDGLEPLNLPVNRVQKIVRWP